MLETLRRYCAGQSVREIEQATGCFRSTLSADLRAVESWTGQHFMRRTAGRHSKSSITAAVARSTRVDREHGQKAASVRDWHALRTTFVTLALSAGVPVELVQRVTGHRTVAVVMEHYFRPDREQFRAALTGALPSMLTGDIPTKVKSADELSALAGKLAAGTATEEDKARLRKLASQV
jgi:integrase